MKHLNFKVASAQESQELNEAKNTFILNFPDQIPIRKIARLWPTDDTLEGARLVLKNIDNRITWLAARDLRPHFNVLNRRNEVMEKIARHEGCPGLRREN